MLKIIPTVNEYCGRGDGQGKAIMKDLHKTFNDNLVQRF